MFIYSKKLSKNKALELSGFRFYCEGTIIDTTFRWSTKSSGDDHWGFFFTFVLFNYIIVDFAIHDMRHQEVDEDERSGLYQIWGNDSSWTMTTSDKVQGMKDDGSIESDAKLIDEFYAPNYEYASSIYDKMLIDWPE